MMLYWEITGLRGFRVEPPAIVPLNVARFGFWRWREAFALAKITTKKRPQLKFKWKT